MLATIQRPALDKRSSVFHFSRSPVCSPAIMPSGLVAFESPPTSTHYLKRSTIIAPPPARASPRIKSVLAGLAFATPDATATATATAAAITLPMPADSAASPPGSASSNSSGISQPPSPPPRRLLKPRDSVVPLQGPERIDDRSLPLTGIDPAPSQIEPQIELERAMQAELVDSTGKTVRLEELIDREFRTVVIFIRHFRSAYCQQYIGRLSKLANEKLTKSTSHDTSDKSNTSGSGQVMSRSLSNTSFLGGSFRFKISANNKGDVGRHGRGLPASAGAGRSHWLRANGVKVIVIGNGSHELIDSYSGILDCPFPIYTDLSPDQQVYRFLGMRTTMDVPANSHTHFNLHRRNLSRSTSGGGSVQMSVDARLANHQDVDKPAVQVFSQAIFNALRMPWKWAGRSKQLGGEVIFEPLVEQMKIKRKPVILAEEDASLCASADTCGTRSPTPSSQMVSRRPSCALRPLGGHAGRARRTPMGGKVDKAGDGVVKVQCKFIHHMSHANDHFPIDELLMFAGLRLNSLIENKKFW